MRSSALYPSGSCASSLVHTRSRVLRRGTVVARRLPSGTDARRPLRRSLGGRRAGQRSIRLDTFELSPRQGGVLQSFFDQAAAADQTSDRRQLRRAGSRSKLASKRRADAPGSIRDFGWTRASPNRTARAAAASGHDEAAWRENRPTISFPSRRGRVSMTAAKCREAADRLLRSWEAGVDTVGALAAFVRFAGRCLHTIVRGPYPQEKETHICQAQPLTRSCTQTLRHTGGGRAPPIPTSTDEPAALSAGISQHRRRH